MFFTKDWVKSKTVWSGFATVIIGILMLAFGVDVQAAGTKPEEWAELFLAAATVLTGGGSIVFRIVSVATLVPKAIAEIDKVKDAVQAANPGGKQPQPDEPKV